MRTTLVLLACASSATLAACIGEISDPGQKNGGPGAGNGNGTQSTADCRVVQAGPSAVRRLTRREYDRTVHDLLGDETAPASAFAVDTTLGSFENNTHSPVTALLALNYMEAADALAKSAVTSQLETLAPCAADADEASCAQSFIVRFGKRAFRRPLDDDAIARFEGVYENARDALALGYADGIRLILTAMLQTPDFLYHIEGFASDATDGVTALDGYEIASRLSYFLWGTMPDDALLDAAESGVLDTPDGIEKQVLRMLEHPYAVEGVRALTSQWLDLEQLDTISKIDEVYPGYDASVGRAMRRETEAFVQDVVWKPGKSLETLFTASYAFVDPAIAAIYGLPAMSSEELQRTELNPKQRAGFLTHASFLSLHAHPYQTSPVHRGKFVRERLLCQTVPAPPPDVDVTPPEPDPTLTTRERFAQHSTDPYCRACHERMDPIGLGFENYDAVGRFRTHENGQEIDASGEVVLSDDIDGPFVGVIELAHKLAGSAQVAECVTTQFLSYAVARGPTNEDFCSVTSLSADKKPAAVNLRQLLIDVTKSDAFRYRKVIPVEACR